MPKYYHFNPVYPKFYHFRNLKFLKYILLFFSSQVFKIQGVFSVYSTSQFGLATIKGQQLHVASDYRIKQGSSGNYAKY